MKTFDLNALDAIMDIEPATDFEKEFDIDFETSTSDNTPKERIRAYSKRYYEWIGTAASKLRDALGIKKLEPVGKYDCCPKCEGDKFIFIRNKGRHVPCARCSGKGYVTEQDKARHNAYLTRKSMGKLSMTFNHYLRPAA
ncbi:hypothetical protein [Shewanella gaetbuli]|uniref:Uncharacterized protein n=1 Tax=Shewanella gaetbuli TaxID=220752 RepID=A0A9X2CH06_9GAMM|nr:hypothetical protein [Shewanella gaetbuli]MCL1142968.1 hypothetical protein [Shewanella gaetbuli]